MEKFKVEINEIAEFTKALSHPARIEILKVLAEKQMCICGEIVEVLPLSQSTVSQHLKELKNIGLIQGEIEGKKSCYCINWERFQELHDKYDDFFQNLLIQKSNFNTCC
ncbi:MAG: winged helix-turn-helix transcriptional regulator [Crocinitomicaceae bacterium]|nr:winged helix-turn-helix transcriptional regulator [Crocinitomicaceae bacterium]